MEALDILEKRIDALNNILGTNEGESSDMRENLTDSLMSANTLITSATSGREKVSEMMKRTNELETYLDPEFLNDQQNLKTKEVYINTVANDLATSFESLQKIKSLEPTLGAEYFRNIPDVTEKIKEMNENLSTCQQQNDIIEESLMIAMQRYSEIQSDLRDKLQKMNERLDNFQDRVEQAKKKASNE
ncbi:CLUMA_CG000448, isoform A [Clunio marinus]|uniref:CLUMA_CG000448, isoform A n=1 Tax=Clunio marinus TaxID=568069 RepID=A0A1J1HFI6_9DIPT|nr:CLUMA_CG000448, isoform A [Clunio marinus]